MEQIIKGKGYLYYHCRHCHCDFHEDLIENNIEELFEDIIEHSSRKGLRKIHNCDELHVGVADLVGYIKLTAEEEKKLERQDKALSVMMEALD